MASLAPSPTPPGCALPYRSKHSRSSSELHQGNVIFSISWGESGRMGRTKISKELCQPLP